MSKLSNQKLSSRKSTTLESLNFVLPPQHQPSQRFVSLMSDAGFKAVFRYEANKDLLIGLLNFLLPKEAEVEDIVEYCDREQMVECEEEKRTTLDLICRGKDGSFYIVEVQKKQYSSFHRRLKFYSSRRYGSQLTHGGEYELLKPVYSISILNYALPHEDESQWDTNHFISCYRDMEIRTHELAEPTIITTFVEVARFTKMAEECTSELDCLIYWFKHSGELDMIPGIINKSSYTSKLAHASELAAMTRNQKIQYDSDMMNEWDIAWQKREERKEGRQEGIQIGLQEGRKEVAKRMKEQKIPIETIALCTGLTVDEVNNL